VCVCVCLCVCVCVYVCALGWVNAENKFWVRVTHTSHIPLSLGSRWHIPCTARPFWRWTGKRQSFLFLNPACLWTSTTAPAWDTRRRKWGAVCWKVTCRYDGMSTSSASGWCFCDLSLTGLKESSKMSLTDSELLIEIMDEARRQVGVVYQQDSQWLASIPWLCYSGKRKSCLNMCN